MLDIFNQDYFDFDMCQAFQAAVQTMSFHLPTFKNSYKRTSTISGSRAGNRSQQTEPIHLNFILSKVIDESNDNKQDEYINSVDCHTDISGLLQKYQDVLAVTKHINQGTNLARVLSSLPPNILNPASYVSFLKEFASSYELDYTEWTPRELKEMGCGAFYAVTQGNGDDEHKTDRLVRIKYSPTNNGDEGNSYWSSVSTASSNVVTKASVLSIDTSINSNSEDVDKDTLSLAEILSRRRAQLSTSSSTSSTSLTTATAVSNEIPRLRLTSFQQQKQNQKPLVLVGKGVCYDTGNITYSTH